MKVINKEILKLAIPSIFANITIPIVGMADVAVAGHLGSAGNAAAATLISGIAIGSLLFDLIYGNFFFLRVGTGGLTAQAYGAGNRRECADMLCRSAGVAFLIASVVLLFQWFFLKAALLMVDCSPEVAQLASEYFLVRVWAAPATLSLMAFRGWFVGMQDSVSSMIVDLVVNIVNVAASIVLALGFHAGGIDYDGIGFTGVAAGTVIAQYTGLLSAVLIVLLKYRRKFFAGYRFGDAIASFKGPEIKRFFILNTDLFIRSLCFMGIYAGFTLFSAKLGDVLLASSTILMKILLLFSYFTDGFAYAGEALTGKYIGMRNRSMMVSAVKYTFVWSMAIALIFIGIYAAAGVSVIKIMTSDPVVVDAASVFLPWLLLMPIVGCAAFTWDGIYVGATASKTIRNAMLLSVSGFLLTYFIGMAVLDHVVPFESVRYGYFGLHILLGAYFVHLIIRTVFLSLRYRRVVLSEQDF